MLFEYYDIDPRLAQVLAGLGLGLIFGISAQISRFCLRRAVAGDVQERSSAAAVWVTGLAVAVLSAAVAERLGFIAIEDHRLLSPTLPIAAILVGGLAFGVGMVLTRGCVSRLTVLSGTGNLRAMTVLLAFAVTAHAALKGVLAPVRTSLGSVSVDLPFGSLAETGFGIPLLAASVTVLASFLIYRARPGIVPVALGAVIGLVAVGGWVLTSTVLLDEFDPLPVQSAAFTLPWSDSLFWVIASSAIPAGFGVGFIGGVLGGSFLSAAARGELQLQSFSAPGETLRYVLGGALMGVGGVLAGGCTIGAGLSGTATGSVAALLALVAIIAGAKGAAALSHGVQGVPATS